MPLQTLDLKAVGAFPKLFLDYITKNETLSSFYNQYPDIEGFRKAIQSRVFTKEKRQTLVSVLEKQYANLDSKPDFSSLLDDKTFTITTGHQLNIFTGPLYVIYKIVTIINLAKQLKAAFPDYTFVPVYWMASEDHDFDEISVFNLFGKNYKWETSQKGAVGRMNPKELRAVCDMIPERVEFFQNAYLNHDTLANAVRCYMNYLFHDQGLICLDADSAELKSIFAPVIKDDILQHSASQIVKTTSDHLHTLGYHTQITPREINFFYLVDGTRERIVKEDTGYSVLHTDIVFSETAIQELIETNPERFSPNVVLRPLYQETILPNLAYIGGPSEVPYWLQLKGVFDHYQEQFPLLMPRNFALIVNEASRKKIDKLGITTEELFADEVTLRKSFVEKNSRKSLSLAFEIDEINDIFERILKKAVIIEPTMKGPVEGVKAKSIKALDHLEKRIKRAEERNQESSVSQLLALKERLFPGGGLQERKENFLNFYLNDHQFIQKLLDAMNPLDYNFNIIEI